MANPADFDRIRQNVAKMVQGGASDADIQTYLSSEGVQPKAEPSKAYQGQFLPFRVDEQGSPHFAVPGFLKGLFGTAQNLGRAAVTNTVIDPETGMPRPDVVNSAADAALAFGPTGAAARAVHVVRPMPKVPTQRELFQAGGEQFDRLRGTGVAYDPQATTDLANQIGQRLEGMALYREQAPTIHAQLDRLRDVPPTPEGGSVTVPVGQLNALRQRFGDMSTDPALDNQARLAARLARQDVLDFLEADPAKGVVAGTPADVRGLSRAARGNYAAAERSHDITVGAGQADLQAGRSYSGLNFDNAARQRLSQLLDPAHPERLAGYSREEVAALNDFVRGGTSRNTLRYVSNILGGGGGLGSVVSGGGVGGAVAGALSGGDPAAMGLGAATAASAGLGLKILQNALARRGLSRLDEQIRSRSPLMEERMMNRERVVLDPKIRNALMRALMAGQVTP